MTLLQARTNQEKKNCFEVSACEKNEKPMRVTKFFFCSPNVSVDHVDNFCKIIEDLVLSMMSYSFLMSEAYLHRLLITHNKAMYLRT